MQKEGIDKIEENRHEINTEKSTAWTMKVFREWLVEKKITTELDEFNEKSLF